VPSIPLPDPQLGDEAVSLSPFDETEVDGLVEVCNDPAIARFTFIPTPYEPRHAVDFVAGQRRRRMAGQAIDLAVRHRDSGALAGAVGLRNIGAGRSSCEVGYWVSPGARGGGIAPRAVTLICRWAFASLAVGRIVLPADAENEASRRVAEKAGFALTTERRQAVAKGRHWRMVVYAMERPPMVRGHGH
jgi:RimJ/RimL family protein N-acetyltransferase